MRTFGIIVAAIIGFVLMSLILRGCGFAGAWMDDAAKTAHKEYDASAMLKKYEWFKDQSQRIQKMDQDIANTKTQVDKVRIEFERDNGTVHANWDPITKKQYNEKIGMTESMYMATVSQRNSLVADYNSQSSKFNWEPFKSKTDLPPMQFTEYQ